MKKPTPLTKSRQSYERMLNDEWPGLELDRLRRPRELTKDEVAVFGELGNRWLHFFTVFILGYELLTPREGFHGEVCERLERLATAQAQGMTVARLKRAILDWLKEKQRGDAVMPTIELADYAEWLPRQPQCDLLLTDPPYMTCSGASILGGYQGSS